MLDVGVEVGSGKIRMVDVRAWLRAEEA